MSLSFTISIKEDNNKLTVGADIWTSRPVRIRTPSSVENRRCDVVFGIYADATFSTDVSKLAALLPRRISSVARLEIEAIFFGGLAIGKEAYRRCTRKSCKGNCCYDDVIRFDFMVASYQSLLSLSSILQVVSALHEMIKTLKKGGEEKRKTIEGNRNFGQE